MVGPKSQILGKLKRFMCDLGPVIERGVGDREDVVLDYDLGKKGDAALYEFLYRCIKNDITSGAIEAGDRLPSKRRLAQHLGVSVVTVEAAYSQLVAEGYVYTRPKSGYFACELPRPASTPAATQTARRPRPAVNPQVDATHTAVRSPTIDLTGASAPLDASAARLWSRELRAACAQEPEDLLFSPTPTQGSPRLQQAIADHLRQTRGMVVDPTCIVVAAGAQILDNMLVQLLGREKIFAVEDPGYLRLTSLYAANNVQVAHVALDREGIKLDELLAAQASVVHIMPSHQFPTGRVTSISRRYELLSWASTPEQDRWIIEDDYDCEFRLAGRPVPSLASIDAEGRVIYTNTFSKSMSAGLRLAYMVLPPQLAGRFSRQMTYLSSTVSSIEQITLARLLESGAYERHVMRVRKQQREVRDALLDALKASPAAARLHVEEADSGLHFVLAAQTDKTEAQVAAAARKAGVALAPLGDFAHLPANKAQADGLARFVIQYGSINSADVPKAVGAIERAI